MKKRGASNRTARRVAVKEWRARALQLRIHGWTLARIAKRVGKAISTVHEAIEAEIRALPQHDAERLRAIESARLDAVVSGALKGVSKGNVGACFAVIAAVNTRARLLGLNEVQKVDVTAALNLTFDAKQQLYDRLAALAGGDGEVLASPAAADVAASKPS